MNYAVTTKKSQTHTMVLLKIPLPLNMHPQPTKSRETDLPIKKQKVGRTTAVNQTESKNEE